VNVVLAILELSIVNPVRDPVTLLIIPSVIFPSNLINVLSDKVLSFNSMLESVELQFIMLLFISVVLIVLSNIDSDILDVASNIRVHFSLNSLFIICPNISSLLIVLKVLPSNVPTNPTVSSSSSFSNIKFYLNVHPSILPVVDLDKLTICSYKVLFENEFKY
jgi:hypothetical protein